LLHHALLLFHFCQEKYSKPKLKSNLYQIFTQDSTICPNLIFPKWLNIRFTFPVAAKVNLPSGTKLQSYSKHIYNCSLTNCNFFLRKTSCNLTQNSFLQRFSTHNLPTIEIKCWLHLFLSPRTIPSGSINSYGILQFNQIHNWRNVAGNGGFEGGEKDQGEASLAKARERPPFLLPQPFCCPIEENWGRQGRACGGDQDGKGGHA
jgi:hypothetical protein